MSRTLAAVAAAAFVATGSVSPAAAKDRLVRLTLDGRPLDRPGAQVALLHRGVVYADVVDLVKAFSALLTFHGKAVWVTVGDTYAVFTAGSRTATVDRYTMDLPGACFMRDGDLYVPLTSFAQIAKGSVRFDAAHTHADVSVDANPVR
ncbi:MAG TPA: stalk domain-containing protein [Candidatus Baltobacteraceae bacterium]|nr:stalk domain-containing protein [Candidatus Baltobacteraceae bacterium]